VRTILVDDDLYAHLLKNTQEIGESATSILRRLLGLSGPGAMPQLEIQNTFDFLKNPELFQHLNNTHRFLFILSWAYRRNSEKFDQVISIEGRRRKYFARDAKTLLQSGESVNPRPIQDSPFWVITNSSTAKKHEMLSDVFRLLGYETGETSAMINMMLRP
jgi:negative modulator of initiation of replication